MPAEFDPEIDKHYMERCLQLAHNGESTCSPNPMVGAVIVKDQKIIGEGWHMKSGLPHAEPNAIKSVRDQDMLKGATLYVSLEPCSHYGKTPPCADLIIKKNIRRVVVGTLDINPLVAGRGIKKLREAGIDVAVGVEQKACIELNRRFFTFHSRKRPYVILKWAQTADGFIDYRRKAGSDEKPLGISSDFTGMLVHNLRSECDVVLVGSRTAILDNPKLNVRDWYGRNPVRSVIDRNLCLPNDLNIMDNTGNTIVFTEKEAMNTPSISYVRINSGDGFISQILDVLYKKDLHTLLVEGGKTLLSMFLKAGIWDEIRIETSLLEIGNGITAPQMEGIESVLESEESTGEGKSFRKIRTFYSPSNIIFENPASLFDVKKLH